MRRPFVSKGASKLQAAVIAVIIIVAVGAGVAFYLSLPALFYSSNPSQTIVPTPTPSQTSTSTPTPATPISTEDSEWRLLVDGFVQRPLNLTFGELVSMPKSTVNAELYCVDAPNRLLASGSWTGVRLGHILETAGFSPEAVKVAFYAEDGYTTDLTVSTAMSEDIILAYEKDGELLSEKLRLVVPGKWGYKWISRVTHIELVNYDFKGFWESRGYSDEAEI